MPPVDWLAGWVQLWFSIAITNTVLTSCACALKLHAAKSASVPKSRGSRIVYIFESPRIDFAWLPEFASCHALAIHLEPTTPRPP